MEEKPINDNSHKVSATNEKVEHPEPDKYDGTIEDFLNNGYITFEEFINRIKKYIPSNDK
jgi:hypothetical protein